MYGSQSTRNTENASTLSRKNNTKTVSFYKLLVE